MWSLVMLRAGRSGPIEGRKPITLVADVCRFAVWRSPLDNQASRPIGLRRDACLRRISIPDFIESKQFRPILVVDRCLADEARMSKALQWLIGIGVVLIVVAVIAAGV